MTTTTTTRLKRGFRAIPEVSNYAINKSGQIYNINSGRNITPYRGAKSHWSGRVKLVNDYGARQWFNIAELVSEVFGITREATLRRNLQTQSN